MHSPFKTLLNTPCKRLPAAHRWDKESESYFPTDFGKATLSSGLPPDEALLVKQDLARARMGFCMATDLHLTYLITPVREELQVDWNRFYDMFERLAGAELKVAGFVGVAPYHIVQQKIGAIRRGAKMTPQQQEQCRVATRCGMLWAGGASLGLLRTPNSGSEHEMPVLQVWTKLYKLLTYLQRMPGSQHIRSGQKGCCFLLLSMIA